MLSESLEENKAGLSKANWRVRGLLGNLKDLGGDTRKSIQGRLKDIEAVLDEEG